jgi:hypothetical protein
MGVVEKVNLAREAAQLTEFWCQRVLASGNGNLRHGSCSSGLR